MVDKKQLFGRMMIDPFEYIKILQGIIFTLFLMLFFLIGIVFSLLYQIQSLS